MSRSKVILGIVSDTESAPADGEEDQKKFMQRKDVAVSTILLLFHGNYFACLIDPTKPKVISKTFKPGRKRQPSKRTCDHSKERNTQDDDARRNMVKRSFKNQ